MGALAKIDLRSVRRGGIYCLRGSMHDSILLFACEPWTATRTRRYSWREIACYLEMRGRVWPRNIQGIAVGQGENVVVIGGLLIGLAYGAVGLLSGFCLLSGLRGWWAEGDGRLIRTFALALSVAIIAAQLLAAGGFVDLGKSIYLQPSFSVPLMFFGGLLFGYGMVMSNGCPSRALVLLGRGNLRSFLVVVVIGIVAQMTLKGLIAPARIVVL